MSDAGCLEAMELLNMVFSSGIISNDGHQILARLSAGDEVGDIASDLSEKFGNRKVGGEIRRVMDTWPPLHVEAVSQMVGWALGKLDTDDRVMIRWKGDADHPETVTRIELRDHEMLVEFAHPPVPATTPLASS